jgi:hypothetical protein
MSEPISHCIFELYASEGLLVRRRSGFKVAEDGDFSLVRGEYEKTPRLPPQSALKQRKVFRKRTARAGKRRFLSS